MTFVKTYDYLEPHKYFYTIWVALPNETKELISRKLAPIVPFCEWVSMYTNDHSKQTPHISLRYLGYEATELKEKAKKDKILFEDALRDIKQREITLGDITLWIKKHGNEIIAARLNWQINDKTHLIAMHKKLLEIDGYYFFKELEGENYDPHISLGMVNLRLPEALNNVKLYLDNLKVEKLTFNLTNFGMNFASKTDRDELTLSI